MTNRVVRALTQQVGEELVLGSIIYYTVIITTGFNPLMPNDLYRCCAVSPLKIKISSKYMGEKPTNATIINSVY
jgi:hypothetical protein